jgi:hypothetical protein
MPIEDDVDCHALATQPGRDRHGKLGVVFNQQYPHRFSWVKSMRGVAIRIAERRLQKGYSVTGPQPPHVYNHPERDYPMACALGQ